MADNDFFFIKMKNSGMTRFVNMTTVDIDEKKHTQSLHAKQAN